MSTPINVRFPLSEIPSGQALRDLHQFTQGFHSLLKAGQGAYVNDLHQQILMRHTTIVGYLEAATYTPDVLKKVIGTNGYYLKLTTTQCGIYFIWYDSVLKNILFWAPNRFTIIKAMKIIRSRLRKYSAALAPPNPDASQEAQAQAQNDNVDEYADMPGLIPGSDDDDQE
jgi:hypothetical protein